MKFENFEAASRDWAIVGEFIFTDQIHRDEIAEFVADWKNNFGGWIESWPEFREFIKTKTGLDTVFLSEEE